VYPHTISLSVFLFLALSFHLRAAAAALAGVVPKAVSLSWSARVQVSGEEEEGGWGVCVRRYAKRGVDKGGVGRVKRVWFL